MPLFGFVCNDCGAESEVLVRGDAKPACAACGSKRLEKQLSHFATATRTPEPQGCGAQSCCRLQGGACMN